MTLRILSGLLGSVKSRCLAQSVCISGTFQQKRYRRPMEPRLRIPYWIPKKESELDDQQLTPENQKFIDKIIAQNYTDEGISVVPQSPLKVEPFVRKEWFPGCQRTGLIGIKIGYLPQWTKDGKQIYTTLIQIKENHVINYIPPNTTVDLRKYALKYKEATKDMGDLVVGAVNINPQNYTKSYCNIFNNAGTMPKKTLTKFAINPDAVIQPGTALYAGHFQVGDLVDITGQTIYRGFQGVMKRWGFHGMPASHGQTKTHRRPGCIGGPGSRVWPGKKMPGHVGYRHRTVRNLKIVRINHKHNVLYVTGCIPGDVNSVVYVHDNIFYNKSRTTPPHFPTYYKDQSKEPLPDEEYDSSIFQFSEPTIMFEKEKVKKSK